MKTLPNKSGDATHGKGPCAGTSRPKADVTKPASLDCVERHAQYPEWLREAAAKGGKKSRRKLTPEEARRIAGIRWAKKIKP